MTKATPMPIAHGEALLQCWMIEQAAGPDLAACDERVHAVELDPHAGGHHTARNVDYMDRHSGHQFSLAPESFTGWYQSLT
jgi:hypothetical protein